MHSEHLDSKPLMTVTIGALILGPLLLCSLYGFVHWSAISALCEGSGDYVLALLEIEKAARFEAFTGPYSRFQVHHPAPSWFYLLAGLSKGLQLPGSERGAASLAQLLINTILLFAATAALARVRGALLQTLATFYLFIFLFTAIRPEGLHDIWGPSQVVIPVFCFLCSAPLIIRGKLAWSFWFVVSAILALSSHMGTLAIVAPVSLLCAFGLIRGKRYRHHGSRLATLSIVMAILCALAALTPLLLDAFTNHGGNLLRLLTFLAHSPSSEKTAGLSEAPRFLGSIFSTPFGLPDWLGAYALVAAAVVVIWRHIVTVSSTRIEAMVALTGLLGAVLGASSIRGPLYPYLMFSVCAIAALLLPLCVQRTAEPRGRSAAFSSPIPCAALAAICLTVSVWLTTRWPAPQQQDCADSLEPFVTAFSLSKTERVELRPEGAESWQALASSVYRLYRDGYAVCVPTRWGFLVGEALTCTALSDADTPRRHFSVVDTDERTRPLPPEAITLGKIAWRPREDAT